MNKILTVILSEELSTSEVLKLFADEFDNLDVRETHNCTCAFDTISTTKEKSILIVDLSMNKQAKIDLILNITKENKNCKVLALSDNPSVDLIIEIMRAGTKEFLPVPIIKNEFCSAEQNSFFIIGTGRNSLVPALMISIIRSTDGLSDNARTLQFLFSFVMFNIKSILACLFIDKSTIKIDFSFVVDIVSNAQVQLWVSRTSRLSNSSAKSFNTSDVESSSDNITVKILFISYLQVTHFP